MVIDFLLMELTTTINFSESYKVKSDWDRKKISKNSRGKYLEEGEVRLQCDREPVVRLLSSWLSKQFTFSRSTCFHLFSLFKEQSYLSSEVYKKRKLAENLSSGSRILSDNLF